MVEKREGFDLPTLFKKQSMLWNDLENGTIELKTAAEMNNTAGKMIGVAGIMLSVYALRKEAPPRNLPFFQLPAPQTK